MNNNKIDESLKLCSSESLSFDVNTVKQRLQEYCALIKEWNRYSNLVSRKDAQDALAEHCGDSISLAPVAHQLFQEKGREYWDLGTGGGFPAIPICILLPELPTFLVERNIKKCTFLRKVCNRLGLKHISIENHSFSTQTDHDAPRIFTSRAIEKPERVIPEILASLSPEDVYLCQSEAIHSISNAHREMFHVEPIEDEFSASGIRRNKLYRVLRK